MQTVKKHLLWSFTTSVRSYFGSGLTEFDPASDSLRWNFRKEYAKAIYDLADGATGDDEEKEIRDRMVGTENSYELIRMIEVIEGWSGLDDELPEAYLDPIATQLTQVLDQRDFVVYQLIRRYLSLLDYNNSPNLGDCLDKLLTWPSQYLADEINLLLGRKEELLKSVTNAGMRERVNMVSASLVHPDVIARIIAANPPKVNELVSLAHEVNYTTRICQSLAALDFQPLYAVVMDMVDPTLTNLQRIACRDTCVRMKLEFAAAKDAVDVAGSNEAKGTINRFMLVLSTTINNFPANVPNPGAIGAIAAAIGSVAATVADLKTIIANLPDALAGVLTLGAFLGTNGDDLARTLVSKLQAQQSANTR